MNVGGASGDAETSKLSLAKLLFPKQRRRQNRFLGTLSDKGTLGLILGPLLAVTVYLVMPESLNADARLTAALTFFMATWWITEAVPIPVTSLLPLLVFPLASGDSMDSIGSSYGNSVIFLFMGGFMLALAMQKSQLHIRIALMTISFVGTKPSRMIAGFMAATAFISFWVSNTATAVMMLPIGISVLVLVSDHLSTGQEGIGSSSKDAKQATKPAGTAQQKTPEAEASEAGLAGAETVPLAKSNFGTSLMLGLAYSASIGGLGTLISTPPVVFLAGYLQQNHGIEIGFAQWMLVGVPTVAIMLAIIWFVLTKVLYRPEIDEIPGGKSLIKTELQKLGRMSRAELSVLLVFALAIFGWVVLPMLFETSPLSDAGVALAAAFLLFMIPSGKLRHQKLLDWDTAVKLPWGILLLFGGGLALSAKFTSSGLSDWIGEQVAGIGVLPIIAVIFLVTALVMAMTEITSNTATAATFLPIFGGVAAGIGADPLLLTIPVALAATACFMLPVATPPNAIAYSSGYITMGQMVRAGIWLNIIGTVVITVLTLTLVTWVFGIVY